MEWSHHCNWWCTLLRGLSHRKTLQRYVTQSVCCDMSCSQITEYSLVRWASCTTWLILRFISTACLRPCVQSILSTFLLTHQQQTPTDNVPWKRQSLCSFAALPSVCGPPALGPYERDVSWTTAWTRRPRAQSPSRLARFNGCMPSVIVRYTLRSARTSKQRTTIV